MSPIEKLLETVEWVEVEPPETIQDDMPYATHTGVLQLNGIEIPCAILSNGQRIFYGDFMEELMSIFTDTP